jgi:hypothetical protein
LVTLRTKDKLGRELVVGELYALITSSYMVGVRTGIFLGYSNTGLPRYYCRHHWCDKYYKTCLQNNVVFPIHPDHQTDEQKKFVADWRADNLPQPSFEETLNGFVAMGKLLEVMQNLFGSYSGEPLNEKTFPDFGKK